MQRVGALIFVTVLTGCANPVNQRTAENYYAAGERALAAGALPLAKQNFSRALANARVARLGPIAEGEAASKLAQVLGNMCDYDEAEKMFLYALAAEEAAFGIGSPRTTVTRIELAQFSFDVGRDEQAINHFRKAFEVGGEGLERGDPHGYARLLDDYSVALERSGMTSAAADAKSRASALRTLPRTPGRSVVASDADYVPYPKSCK